MKKILFITVIVIVGILIGIYAYLGGFTKVEVRIEEQGGEVLVYENMKGDYKNTGKVLEKIYYSLLNDDKIETYKGFGYYLDNPDEVSKEDLRSEIGVILEPKDYDKIPELEKKYLVRTFPKKEYIVTEFPYKNMASIYMNIIKAYPAVFAFFDKGGYQWDGGTLEIYDMPAKKTFFRSDFKK